jgi:isopentenyldiphosphate isomerase
MHMVVVTSDNRLLLTQRSPKVEYYPGTWSASVEEQLLREDFKNGEQATALNWGKRLLKEELGLEPDAYHNDNLRILSVFLESDILNISVCGYAELRINSVTFDTIIRGHPRTDYEFTDWTFIELDKTYLFSELFKPRRSYHPTSGYRFLQTLLKNFGTPKDSDIYSFVTD